MKDPERENVRLKRRVADLSLEKQVLIQLLNVAVGSKADKPSQAKIHFCPLLSESGHWSAAMNLSF